MQEVSGTPPGTFLSRSRADSKDDKSCAQCIPIANKFLGSDCKELLCVMQASAAMKDEVMASSDDRKKASTAFGAFMGCAKQNKCNLEAYDAAADKLHIDFGKLLAGLLQVETSVQDTGSCAQCLRPANELVGSNCKDLICVVKAFDAQKEVIMATEAGRKKAGDVHDNLSRCAKENKCDLQPGISAAAELGLDLGADSIFQGSFVQAHAVPKADAEPKAAIVGFRAGATKVTDAAVVHKDKSQDLAVYDAVRSDVVDAYVKEALENKKKSIEAQRRAEKRGEAQSRHQRLMDSNPIYRAAHTAQDPRANRNSFGAKALSMR